MKKMAVRKYYGHFYKPTREAGYTNIQEFIIRTRRVKTFAVNTFFGKRNRKQFYSRTTFEGLRVPLLVRVPQFGNHCVKGIA